MGKTMKSLGSIQRRLLLYLSLVLPLLGILISLMTATPLYQAISADDDANLQHMARLMSEAHRIDFTADMSPDEEVLLLMMEDLYDSQANDTAFAVWDNTGQQTDGDGAIILAYQPNVNGFVNTDKWWKASAWRVYYLTDSRNGKTVAVAQPWRERLAVLLESMLEQLLFLLLLLPILLATVWWGVRVGLRPLRQVAHDIEQRHALDLTPIQRDVPTELQPLTAALNALFIRVEATLTREQRFTADAAHELRSPLTAIKIQVEALNNKTSDDAQAQHLHTIQRTIDRAAHLIEQLLTLAKLDPMTQIPHAEPIDWLDVSDHALQSVNVFAREKRIRLHRQMNDGATLPIQGDATLLTLLLRNLLDNAVRYSEPHSEVTLTLDNDCLSVRDQGQGIAEADLPRVQERFFRPPGQTQSGSGLGLSIVAQIAALHGLTVTLDNHPDGGVTAILSYNGQSRVYRKTFS